MLLLLLLSDDSQATWAVNLAVMIAQNGDHGIASCAALFAVWNAFPAGCGVLCQGLPSAVAVLTVGVSAGT